MKPDILLDLDTALKLGAEYHRFLQLFQEKHSALPAFNASTLSPFQSCIKSLALRVEHTLQITQRLHLMISQSGFHGIQAMSRSELEKEVRADFGYRGESRGR